MKNTLMLLLLILSPSSIFASTLTCVDIYTTTTAKKGQGSFSAEGSVGNRTTRIKLEFGKEKIHMSVGVDKVELIYLAKSAGGIYMAEQTQAGNINLFTLSGNNLTISKSYDVFGMAIMNVQTMYECTPKR